MNARTVNCALEGLQLSGGELARGQRQRLLGHGVDPGAGDNTAGHVDGQPREGRGLEPGEEDRRYVRLGGEEKGRVTAPVAVFGAHVWRRK